MEPRHVYLDQLLQGKISRRDFLLKLAAAGACTPLVMNYLRNPAPAFAMPPAQKLSPPGALSQEATAADPLFMDVWSFRPDVVQESLDTFQQQYNESVKLQVIPGDFNATIENKYITKSRMDLHYGHPFTAIRWYRAGWIEDYEQYWLVDDVKKELYPAIRDALTFDDRLLALPYFVSVRGTVCSNELVLEKAGLKGKYPKNWKELYAQLREIKKSGAAEKPWLPHWAPIPFWGITAQFIFESMARGDALFDAEFNPVFNVDTEAMNVLQDWQAVWSEGLVPEGVLTMNESDFIGAFASGRYAYSPQQSYDLRTFNDPTGSNIAGHCMAVPADGQSWGFTDLGAYVVAKRDRTPEQLARAFNLAGFMGYKDKNGEPYVARKWVQAYALAPGFPAIFDDPEIIKTFEEWMPDKGLLDTIRGLHNVVPFPPFWRASWYIEWRNAAENELPQVLLGQKKDVDVIKTLRDTAAELKARYA